MLEAFFLPFVTILLAEIGDKTQLLLVAFSARNASMAAFTGAMGGFIIADGIAVIAGALVLGFVPEAAVKAFAAAVFFAFGIVTLREKGEAEKVKAGKATLVAAFSLVAVAEFGDKSQIAAALFAGQYNALLVMLGAMSAIAAMTAMSFVLGRTAGKMVKAELIRKISGVVFIIVGVLTTASVW